MKISFIIPVYNVEKYLDQCIQSIVEQTYTNFEIILVNDGSEDNSQKICEKWASNDNRIKLINKSNGGLSDARNTGIKIASGEYLIFVDSDDFWIGNNSLMDLVKIIEKNKDCDFFNFNCAYFYSKNNLYKNWPKYNSTLTKSTDKNTVISSLISSGVFPMSAWLKIISRDFLLNNNLTFIRGIRGEDIPWFIELLDKSQKSIFINHYVYAYRQNVIGSITNTSGEKSYNDLYNILIRELELMDSRSFSKEGKNSLYSFLAYEFCILLSSISNLPKSIQQIKRKELLKYKWLLNYTANPKVKKVAFINNLFGIKITELILRFYMHKIRK